MASVLAVCEWEVWVVEVDEEGERRLISTPMNANGAQELRAHGLCAIVSFMA